MTLLPEASPTFPEQPEQPEQPERPHFSERFERLTFDLRADPSGGFSGGVVLREGDDSVSFLRGNQHDHGDRRYVSVDYRKFSLLLDRDDLPGLTPQHTIDQWGLAALKVLIGQLTPVELVRILATTYVQGERAGAAQARQRIQDALGL